MDNGYRMVRVSDTMTVKEAVSAVLARLEVREAESLGDCFSLSECVDGSTISRPLPGGELLGPLLTSWKAKGLERARLVLRVSLMARKVVEAGRRDVAVEHLLFSQAVYDVVAGIAPVGASEAIRLGALQVQATLGDHDPVRHRAGVLRSSLSGVIPTRLLPSKPAEDWESALLMAHKVLGAAAKLKPKRAYLDHVETKGWYGRDFFLATQSFSASDPRGPPGMMIFSVFQDGIEVRRMDKSLVDSFPLAQLYRWGFKRNVSFYWELKPAFSRDYPATVPASAGRGPLFQVATKEGKVASDLLTAYAMQVLAEIKARQAEGKKPLPAQAAVVDPTQQAAAKVGAAWKGYKVRTELQKKSAATMIQALVRGYKARRAFEAMIDELERELEG